MKRSFPPLLSLVVMAAVVAPARAQYDVPAWYIQYDVTVATKYTAPTSVRGSTTTTWDFERAFSASARLDLRNEGSVFSPPQVAMDPEKIKNMSQGRDHEDVAGHARGQAVHRILDEVLFRSPLGQGPGPHNTFFRLRPA